MHSMDDQTTSRSPMFIDYLSVEQVYSFDLPQVADITIERFCSRTGESLSSTQPSWKHEGSYSTKLTIRVDGRRLIVSGNPSAMDRLENLFGYQTIDQCVRVYNRILAEYGLPALTRCTRIDFLQAPRSRVIKKPVFKAITAEQRLDLAFDAGQAEEEGDANAYVHSVETSHKHVAIGDGMRITRIDLTTNRTVGQGNEQQYVKALSTQRAGYKVGNLYTDGCTVDWQARDQYRKAYIKATALAKFQLPKAIRAFGPESEEVHYLHQCITHCQEHGVVRMEQELKREYLLREGMAWWGLFDESRLKKVHEQFLAIDERLTVTAMDIETISDHLVSQGVVDNTKAANTTAQYALAWAAGKQFDLTKRQVKEHRARLRQIGIDIANPCDTSRFSPVVHKQRGEVIPVDVLAIPTWYRRPAGHLQLVAA